MPTDSPDSAPTVDRSKVIAESHPGARNDIQRMVDETGGWHCEQHPDQPWPHDLPDGSPCAGPGFLPGKDDE